MAFVTRSHRLAALCGSVPLSLGTGLFFIWLAVRWDWLMFAGAIVLYGGVVVVAVGLIALAHGCWVASSITTASRRGIWISTLSCAGLLLVNAPVAAGIISAAIAIMTRYTVVVSNTSQERLDDVRVLGGGCDARFGSIVAGTIARRSFWIRRDGVLTFRAFRGPDTIEHVIDQYVTNNGGGHTTVTVLRDDKIVVLHLAVRELAWADRIRDELFWLNRASCAALAGADTRRLTRVAPDGRGAT